MPPQTWMRFGRWGLRLFGWSWLVVCLLLPADSAHAVTVFGVTNTSDSGSGSLRQAILDANANPGLDIIVFNLPINDRTISPSSPLPPITDRVKINPTWACSSWPPQPYVELDGSLAGPDADGFNIQADGSFVAGFYINRFSQDGIEISASNVAVACNIIGLDAQGSAAGNGALGVLITGGNNIVGYVGAADAATNAMVGNVIADNVNGVFIYLDSAVGNIVRGNYIGVDATGLLDRGNQSIGVFTGYGAAGTIIGGATAADRNIIAGNGSDGVGFYQNGTSPVNQVMGNYIGLTAAGDAPLPNDGNGVFLVDANANVIGGVNPGQGNRIAFNGAQGVNVIGNANRILGNQIYDNAALGIDLGNDGVTVNDPGDGDSGANNMQNYPVIAEAYAAGADAVVVRGSLNSSANSTFRIEIFASEACDASGFGEGATYLGFAMLQTDGSGNGQFTFVSDQALPAGQQLTATATDNAGSAPASTSEFSLCKPLDPLPAAVATLPLPRRDVAATDEDVPVTIDVLANDRDPQDDPLTLVAVGNPSAGTAQIVANKILYTPAPDFNGNVAFFYSVNDGNPDNTVQSNVSIQVNPVNDAPDDIILTPNSIAENLPAATSVGVLTAVDVDDTDSFDFSLTENSPDNAFFEIIGDQLRARSSFDFETKASYAIAVRVRDRSGATFHKEMMVAVLNANDAPTAVTLSNNRIDENQAAGVTVGTFGSVDSDAGDTHTYALVEGTGSDDNAAFRIEGSTLRTNALLDYETKPIYSLRVRSSDNAGAGREQVFLVYLNNLPSPPDVAVNALSHCSGNPITLIDANAGNADRRVLVRIDSVVVSNKTADSCTITGKMTIISNGSTVSDLDFRGDVNGRNQFDSESSIPDFEIAVAGLPLLARGVQIEYYVERAGLRITRPALKMPADWGGLAAPISVPTLLDNSGIKFGSGAINLPTIKTKSGFELGLSGSLVPAPGGYRINADGVLTIPNIGKKKAPGSQGRTCSIGAGVTIYASAQGQTVMEIAAGEALTEIRTGPTVANLQSPDFLSPSFANTIRLDQIRASFGCDPGIAIGNTGLFLTSLSGQITLTPNNEVVSVQVTIEAGKKLPLIGPVIDMEGTMDLRLRPAFQLDLGVALNVLSFEVARAAATVTTSSFKTTITVQGIFAHGSASINAWSSDGKFHFTGSGRMALEVRKGSISETCTDFPCRCSTCWGWGFLPYPCKCSNCPLCVSFPPFDTGRLAEVGVDVGEFTNGRYGFKGFVGVLGQSVGFYIDETGKLSFSNIERYQLIQGPTVAAMHQAWLRTLRAPMSINSAVFANYTFLDDGSGQSSGVIIRTPLVKPTLDLAQVRSIVQASDVISKVNLVQHGDVGFTLKARGPLAFTLITPQGLEVTPANFEQSGTLGYVIAYTASVGYEAENNLDESGGSDTTAARLRFTPLSDDSEVNGVDLRIDDATVYANLGFGSIEGLDPIVLAAGNHSVELVKHGTNDVVLATTIDLSTGVDYSLLVVPFPPAAKAASPQFAISELVLVADDNAAPATVGNAKVRFYNAATANLNMLVRGASLFSNIEYKGTSPYALLAAGTYTVEFRFSNNDLASQPLVVDLADGGVYTFFTVDEYVGPVPVAVLQRQDAIYAPTYLIDYAVDQAEMGEEWQVKVVGDTDNIPYVIALAGPANPPVLASVVVDAGNLAAAQVSWQLTSDWSPTKVTLFVNPGAIAETLTVTNPETGVATTQQIPLFEGYPVAEYAVSDLAQLGGQPMTRQIDLSQLPSGSYHLWVRAEDGVNPPVNVYAAAPTLLATAVRDAYGFNAVRVAKEGYDPLRLLADAATIVVDHAADFPASWNAAISTTLDAATDALYIEWPANPHPDVDSYRLYIGAAPLAPSVVITAGGVVIEYDDDGQATGAAFGFITLDDIQPDVPYYLSVEAVDSESGRTVRSQEVLFNASAGAFVLTTPQTTVALPARGVATVPVTLNELQPLFYPQVGLAVDLSNTPLGVTASFAGDLEGIAMLTASQPAIELNIAVDSAVADGRYPLIITGYSGATTATLTLQLVVGDPEDVLYLPVIAR